jgi:hypothetical protein
MRLGFSAVRGKERYSAGVFRQVRRGLRQAWELPCAGKGAALPCYLALRPDKDWAEVAAAILEGPSDARRDKARTAAEIAAFARLHEHWRELHGHGSAGPRESKILALALDGAALL